MRTELDFRHDPDITYEIIANLYEKWDYSKFMGQYVNVADTLRKAMSSNRHLRVHVASAFYDLATPYFATEYTLSHLGLEPELHENINTSTYESGHMMYVRHEDLAKLKSELASFIAG